MKDPEKYIEIEEEGSVITRKKKKTQTNSRVDQVLAPKI